MKTLHILNGDSTAGSFRESTIKGDFVVWREALSCGPVIPAFATDKFWQIRASFLIEEYGGVMKSNLTMKDYEFRTIKEFSKLKDLDSYQQITLWFEYDLFCQINMIALLGWFANQQTNPKTISLICINNFAGHPNFKGLGELSPAELASLESSAVVLEQSDLIYANKIWNAYAGPSPHQLIDLVTTSSSPQFPFLKKAVEHHLQLFPSVENGLNILENEMLELIDQGTSEKNKLVVHMLKKDFYFGFGDTHYFWLLNKLSPLFEDRIDLSLNTSGISVLKNRTDFLTVYKTDFKVGGANARDFRWHSDLKKLIKTK